MKTTRHALLITVVIFIVASLAQAHEFWMQPQKFFFKPGEQATVSFMVGENFTGEAWDLKRHRIARVQHWWNGNNESIAADTLNAPEKKLRITLTAEGTHLVVMQSNNAYLELAADKFNEYLKEDGLDNIQAMREKAGTTGQPSREYYARCAKLLLQCGSRTDDTYKAIAGMPLEIVPLQNPYAVKPGGELKFQLLFQGKPAPFTLMKVWNRKDGRSLLQNMYSEKDGTITMRVSNGGDWMVSAVKMIPSPEAGADWQSYWASYVFGVQ